MTTPKCVYDYHQLRQLAPPLGPPGPPHHPHFPACDYVFVSGYPDPQSSGLQGFFEWRHHSADADNGGTVIKPASIQPPDKGRWHRVFEGAISVKWFGAIGDGISHPLSSKYNSVANAQTDYPPAMSLNDEIDWAAIQAAINATASSNKPTVCVPPGRYRLNRAIRADVVDELTLVGSVGAILTADPPDNEPFPEAILVNKNFPSPAEQVSHLAIRDLTIEVINGAGGDVSAGVIQLNNCKDCLVSNVYVKYIGPTPKPKNIDGIVTANGTSGLIQGCIVDGIPKAGIYVAQGSRNLRIEACEVKNTSGPIGQVGILVSGADRIIIDSCLSHQNGAAGLMIAVNGPIQGNPPVPATNIQVVGGRYEDNGTCGIWIASGSNTVIPENIQLVGIAALNNGGVGIHVEAGWDVLIASPTVIDSGNVGIWLENRPGVSFDNSQFDPNHPRTTRVQISNPNIYNSGHDVGVDVPGIGLTAVDQVTVIGGKIYKTSLQSKQEYGIGVFKNEIGDTCTNLRILDVDASVGHIKPLAPLNETTLLEDLSVAVTSGYYRIQSYGNPEGVIAAPQGSEYVDVSTGYEYRKAPGSGSGNTGWTQTFPVP